MYGTNTRQEALSTDGCSRPCMTRTPVRKHSLLTGVLAHVWHEHPSGSPLSWRVFSPHDTNTRQEALSPDGCSRPMYGTNTSQEALSPTGVLEPCMARTPVRKPSLLTGVLGPCVARKPVRKPSLLRVFLAHVWHEHQSGSPLSWRVFSPHGTNTRQKALSPDGWSLPMAGTPARKRSLPTSLRHHTICQLISSERICWRFLFLNQNLKPVILRLGKREELHSEVEHLEALWVEKKKREPYISRSHGEKKMEDYRTSSAIFIRVTGKFPNKFLLWWRPRKAAENVPQESNL